MVNVKYITPPTPSTNDKHYTHTVPDSKRLMCADSMVNKYIHLHVIMYGLQKENVRPINNDNIVDLVNNDNLQAAAAVFCFVYRKFC